MEQTLAKIKNTLAPIYSPREIDSIIRIIFENLLHYSQVDLILHRQDELSDFIKGKIDKVLTQLLRHEPIQYIFNEAYFYGNTLKVTRDTLIPRPETEELVDLIVKDNPQADLNVLDIGTGSGAIALSLARALKFTQVSAIDISNGALEVAKENAEKLKVKVKFTLQDILTAQPPHSPQYDIIVSNPPYVTENERKDMEANVLDYEPATALFVPNDNPLQFYSAIAKYALKALKPGGRLYFEINAQYGNEMKTMLQGKGYSQVEVVKDMYGKDRFTVAQLSNK